MTDDPQVTLLPVPAGLVDPVAAAQGRALGAGWPHPDTAIALQFTDIGGETYLIVDATGAVVGECGTKGPPTPDGVVEIGYGLTGPSRGRGIGTQAVTALLARLVERPDVRIVEAHVDPDNVPSRRLLERVGFALAGDGHAELIYRRTFAR